MGTKRLLSASCLAVILAGCTTYRPDPLKPSVELKQLRERSPTSLPSIMVSSPGVANSLYDASDGLNEAELVQAALHFNPDLRNRRHDMGKIGDINIFGMVRFKPEMKVHIDNATVGFSTDSNVLYTLLMPNLRAAWRDDELARREQSRFEMLAAEAHVVLQVRRAHVGVLAAEARHSLAQRREQDRGQIYNEVRDSATASPLDRANALVVWQRSLSSLRAMQSDIANHRRTLNRLLGFDPDQTVELTAAARDFMPDVPKSQPIADLDAQLLNGRFELKIEEALYRRAEFRLSQAVMNTYPKLRLGPSVTYDVNEGTKFRVGASLKIPWPEDAARRAEDAVVERDRARASYVSKLHELRAEAHQAQADAERHRLELTQLNAERADSTNAAAAARRAFTDGTLSLQDLLILLERCEAIEWEWLTSAESYSLAQIDLDHATGRLNQYAGPIGDEPEAP